MASLTIRDFDDDLKAELRVRAAQHGRSMEAEVRDILRTALVKQRSGRGLASRIHRRFADVPEPTLDIPPRSDSARAAELPE